MANFQEIIDSEIPVLVDFHATWCGPCKTLAPILKDLKNDLGDLVRIVKIDVDANQKLAQKFNVRGVPTMIIFKDGKQLWRQSGVVPLESLKQVVKQHAK